ncbi:hypothetical protein NM208_g12575 [Fusarium decemcellulare]|uniref:Uncharacterized protein n=1 Tax=Fusarium decemcellulare TaxID=57161 RepID=A0ACC1RRM3_9HYPO|nr:hypothetical protein NM208_g12575 [Fusarium decemcellulare]
MASSLPAQEEAAGTYLESIPYLPALIKARLVSGYSEGETARVWNDILHNVFPGRDNYSTGIEALPEGTCEGLSLAYSVIDVGSHEKKFLVIVCKSPGQEATPSIWQEGAAQLEAHLSPVLGHHETYGAIAVGGCVRLYRWGNSALWDLSAGEMLYLDRQCQTVMRYLVYFREHH